MCYEDDINTTQQMEIKMTRNTPDLELSLHGFESTGKQQFLISTFGLEAIEPKRRK